MSEMVLTQTIVNGCRVDFEYTYPEHWNAFVANPGERLFSEYGFDLKDVPISVLNIQFVANMLTLAMFENGSIYVEELDRTFYEAIPDILDGYRALYPDRSIGCSVICKKLVDNSYAPEEEKVMAFTGGVDATSAMAGYICEKLVLANIWGGDIRLDNAVRYNAHKQYFQRLAQQYGFGFAPVKSNFRFIYVDSKIPYKFAHDWWCAVGHSVQILAVLTPIAYHKKAEKIYMASSYPFKEHEKSKVADCNYMPIVNAFRFGSCLTQQCDTQKTRAEKVQNIIATLSPQKEGQINILACWNHKKDSLVNCCRCEKCARTIMNIKACKADPNLFGFTSDDSTYAYIKDLVATRNNLPAEMWEEIQNAFLSEKAYWRKDRTVSWILKVKINQPKKPGLAKRAYWKARVLGSRVKRKLLSVIK